VIVRIAREYTTKCMANILAQMHAYRNYQLTGMRKCGKDRSADEKNRVNVGSDVALL